MLSTSKKAQFWLLVALVSLLIIWVLKDVLLPFVLGMALAYLLDPLADKLEEKGFTRLWATLIIALMSALIFVLLFVLIVPPLAGQIIELFSSLRLYIPSTLQNFLGLSEADINALAQAFKGNFQSLSIDDINVEALKDFLAQNAGTIGAFLSSAFDRGASIISFVSVCIITPVVTFYLLYDWDDLVAKIDAQIPLDYSEVSRSLAHRIDNVLSAFVRGQFLTGLVLGVFYAVALTLIGLKFGLVIGLGAGLISFVPFIGAFAGFLASFGVALTQFWQEPLWIIVVMSIFAFGQFIEGNFLQPRLVGRAVGLHPVALIFALMAFGSLFGFVGILIAVPVSAAIAVLARHFLGLYRKSSFYKGDALHSQEDHTLSKE